MPLTKCLLDFSIGFWITTENKLCDWILPRTIPIRQAENMGEPGLGSASYLQLSIPVTENKSRVRDYWPIPVLHSNPTAAICSLRLIYVHSRNSMELVGLALWPDLDHVILHQHLQTSLHKSLTERCGQKLSPKFCSYRWALSFRPSLPWTQRKRCSWCTTAGALAPYWSQGPSLTE